MSGKPAARLSDPTACPIPGHGVNPIASGSPDVLFDNLSAARQGDSSACGGALVGNVIPNVLINGKPATTLGSIGSHGNVVIGGSGTVLIGTSHSAAAFSAPSALAVGSAAVQALAPSTPNSPARTTDTIARTWQEEPGDPAPLGLEEEDEEEELEEQTQQGITLRVGFFFDGTGDNDANVARGAQCRANQLGYDAADERALLDYCPPHQMDPMSSYARERTNISRLYDLYRDDSSISLARETVTACIPVYIAGVGTEPDKADKPFPDMALGTGETGVLEKIEQGMRAATHKLAIVRANNPELTVKKIEIDVFGFSRGAAAARHFVNDLRRGSSSLLATAMHNSEAPPLAKGFDWRLGQGIQINLIGLFDTVAAIGDLSDGWDVNDDKNGDLKLYLAAGSAKRVIHLVAGDEYRYNFSLNSSQPNFTEIVLPGAHGDIGGNYPLIAEEKLFLTRPFRDEVDNRLPNEESRAWKQANQALQSWSQRGLIDLAQPNGKLFIDWRQVRSTDNPARRKVIYTQVKLERRVRGEYGRIPLRIMHTLAQEAGVPFRPIPNTSELRLPTELTLIADKLMAYAQGKAPLNLALEEQDLLYAHFLHQAAHWNVYPGESGALTVHFVSRPTQSGQRTVHPNKPDPVNLL